VVRKEEEVLALVPPRHDDDVVSSLFALRCITRTRRPPRVLNKNEKASRLFELLLGAELVRVAALLLAAVDGPRGQTGLEKQ
jgi:hypothetical protein